MMKNTQDNTFFTDGNTSFVLVNRELIPNVQDILDHNSNYHTSIVKTPATGLAARAFEAETPNVEGSRVFRRFMLITQNDTPVAVVDLFVGYPNYKCASLAMCLVRDTHQRKGIATTLLSQNIPRLLAQHHPAVQTLVISITDNNIAALRCLLKVKFERTNSWQKLDVNGQTVTAVTFKSALNG